MLNISATLALVASIASVAIGFIVWKSERVTRSRSSFLLLSVFVCFWIIGNVVFVMSDGGLRYAVALLSYAFALLLAVQLCIFTVLLINNTVKNPILYKIAFPGAVIAIISAVPGFIAYGVNEDGIQTNLLPLVVYGVVLLTYLVSVVILLLVGRARLAIKERNKIDIILAGVGLSGILGAGFNLLLPLLGKYDFVLLGPASAVFFLGAIAYVIVKHGLFDVRLAVVRSTAYFLSLLTIFSLYFGVAFLLSELLSSTITPAVNAVIAIVLALIFQPAKRFFDRWTNRVFYRGSYDPTTFFAHLSDQLRNISDLHELLETAAREIVVTFKAESGFFVVQINEKEALSLGEGVAISEFSGPDLKHIHDYIQANDASIVITDLVDRNHRIYKLLKRRNVEVILPLTPSDGTRSYFFLGSQRGRAYTQRDIDTLKTISNELTIAIQNAIRFEQIRNFNNTLQQRIEDATKELRKTNEQLQRLDAAKDEFVSMASHQLRTPLTSVKGYISMVLEGDVGKITPTQRQMLSEAFTSSERMVHLIGDFLNVSRIQTGKFMLEKKPVDLAKLVSQEIDSLETTIKAHGLKLNYRKPSHFPVLMIDEGKIRQVLMNFIDNAIFYSQEGMTITVKLGIEEGFAVVRVIDTGIGVPKNEQPHLFTKFFRASNARRQRPDGTGVGIFLARKVIAEHGGTMVFESEENKGSTFGFRLPIKKLQASEKDTKLAGNSAYQLKK